MDDKPGRVPDCKQSHFMKNINLVVLQKLTIRNDKRRGNSEVPAAK